MKIEVDTNDLIDFADKVSLLSWISGDEKLNIKRGYYLDNGRKFMSKTRQGAIKKLMYKYFSVSGKWEVTKEKLKETLIKINKIPK